MTAVIRVENLGKCYRIQHEQSRQYTTVRDELSAVFHNLGRSRATVSEETFWALQEVGFEVREGERVGIIGRNGAGKSTLLKLLSRITEPSSGMVSIRGRVASLLEVGTGFHPELSGRENIYLNGAILGMSRRQVQQRFDEIVDFAEVERFLDTPIKRYSSGMYTRLAFAVAAHLDSDILIVDEVLAVGDLAFQKKCLSKMKGVTETGRTVLFVSHNMQAVKRLCDRALVLSDGRIVADHTVDNAIKSYLDMAMSEGGGAGIAEQIAGLPFDPAVQFEAVSVSQDGRSTEEPETDKTLDIRVDFKVKERVRGLRIYFDLCDADGAVLLRSFHDEYADSRSVFDVGSYSATGHIPAGLLGPVDYRLVIRATIFNIRSCTGDGVSAPLRPIQTASHNAAYANDTFRAKLVVGGNWMVKRSD